MQIQKINQISFSADKPQTQNKYNLVKITGYGALGAGLASIAVASQKNFKAHKFLGFCAGILAIIHTGLIEWRHYQRSKK